MITATIMTTNAGTAVATVVWLAPALMVAASIKTILIAKYARIAVMFATRQNRAPLRQSTKSGGEASFRRQMEGCLAAYKGPPPQTSDDRPEIAGNTEAR